jgi:hypothetical protein
MDVKPGDVLFVWGDGLISDIIEWVTDGPAHVALFIDEHTVAEAQGGRSIGERPLSYYLENAERLEVWRDETLTDAERAEMIRYARTLYGSPYDYALIPLEFAHFELGVDIGWYHENRGRICSTYVCECAAHVGRKWANTPNPAPVDDMKGGKLARVYIWEGGKWQTNKRMESA